MYLPLVHTLVVSAKADGEEQREFVHLSVALPSLFWLAGKAVTGSRSKGQSDCPPACLP